MSEEVCQLCFEKSDTNFIYLNSKGHGILGILQKCCDFLFANGECMIDQICDECWKTLFQFNEFCERVREMHESFIENDKDAVAIEYVEEEIDERYLDQSELDTDILPTLTIEKDLENNASLARRQLPLTMNVVRNLEKQLKFEATIIRFSEIDFDKVSRFVNMDCYVCDTKFESFNEAHDHYLEKHKRLAVWNCCKLDLDTPYDIIDHIKYHESIDDFKCAACNKCFLTSNKLRFHIRRNHLPIDDDNYICTICKKVCKNQRLLINHQKNHISVDCPYCEKLVSAANYESHARQHILPTKRPAGSSSTESTSKNLKIQTVTTKKRRANETGARNRKEMKNSTTTNNRQTTKCTLSIEKNESGMFECDICQMKFDQISRVFIHRNKVHV